MTTAKPTATTPRPPDGFRFEDPPEHQPDDMTSFNHLTITGSAHYLLEHFGNRDTTLVPGNTTSVASQCVAQLHYPDLWSPSQWPRRFTSGATTLSQSKGSHIDFDSR